VCVIYNIAILLLCRIIILSSYYTQTKKKCLSPHPPTTLNSLRSSQNSKEPSSSHTYIHTSILPSLTTHQSFTTKKNLFFCFSNFTHTDRERERCHHHHHHLLIISKRSVFPKLERNFFFPYISNHLYFQVISHHPPEFHQTKKNLFFFLFFQFHRRRERERERERDVIIIIC
jgi:hypothetical protein